MSSNRFKPLFQSFKIKAHNISLYESAFTHPSINLNEHKFPDYQRLEFVGDSVLGTIIATLSYKLHPELHEGHLTRLRSSLVDTNSLSKIALQYHFDKYIKVGPSFTSNLSNSPKILEDVFEAFVGAIYLDNGFKYTYKFVENIFKKRILNFDYEESMDYKSKLQEMLQADHHSDVQYNLIFKKGPANKPIFKIGLYFDGVLLGTGIGANKKSAEQEAAKSALKKLAKGNR